MDVNLDTIAGQLSSENTGTVETSVNTTEPTSETLTPSPEATSSEAPAGGTEDDVIEVAFSDGTKEPIKRSELNKYVLRQKDYTRKMQELASTRKKYEALEQNLPAIKARLEFAEQMQQVAQNPAVLFQYALEQVGPENAIKMLTQMAQQNPGAYDPEDIPTYKDAEQMIQAHVGTVQQRLEQLERQTAERIQRSIQEARAAQEWETQAKTYEKKFNEAIDQVLTEFKPLKGLKHMPDVLRYETAKKVDNYIKLNGEEPTFEQAALWLQEAAKEQMATLEAEFAQAKAANPLNNSIEPPGGARQVSVNTGGKTYYNSKTGQTDWDALLSDVGNRLKGVGQL